MGATPSSGAIDAGAAAERGDESPQNLPEPQPNPFVRTADDALSTFAADVDTASYDIFMRAVHSGYLPSAREVRLEEFVNYFHYDYPVPALEDDHPFSISLAASPHVLETGTHVLRVGVQGAEPAEREAANLVFLVDTSGSMAADNKLPLVKQVLLETLDVLRGDDTISIVTYAGDVAVRLQPTGLSEREQIETVIRALSAGGATAGGSGIQLAYQQARAARIEGGINHVLLCTDGDFNVGISNTEALVELIEEERADGITLTALGFGGRNDDAMMERVSNAGNGVYSVLYDADQAVHYAHERLLSSMVHIAQDMKIQVELNPEHVFAYRLLGYENRRVADSDFRDDRVDGGEVGAGHQVTALYELVLQEDDLPGDAELGEGDGDAASLESEVLAEELVRVKVRYEAPGSGEDGVAKEVLTALKPGQVKPTVDEADADLRWAVGVAAFTELLRGHSRAVETSTAALRDLLAPIAEAGDASQRAFLEAFDEALQLL